MNLEEPDHCFSALLGKVIGLYVNILYNAIC